MVPIRLGTWPPPQAADPPRMFEWLVDLGAASCPGLKQLSPQPLIASLLKLLGRLWAALRGGWWLVVGGLSSRCLVTARPGERRFSSCTGDIYDDGDCWEDGKLVNCRFVGC